MIKYPKIGQFRNAIKAVRDHCSYHGLALPTLSYTGTVKLHGTNASIVYRNGVMEVQSRNNVITPEKDNAGFANWAKENESQWLEYLKPFAPKDSTKPLTVYGEWCGGNIQKGVGITSLPKMFVIFGFRCGEETETSWLNCPPCPPIKDTHLITDFPTYLVSIDFNNPELMTNHLTMLTEAVEKECPVAKAMGVANGVGEGIVWKPTNVDYLKGDFFFKVKGEKHSVSHVKTLAPVDVEKLNSVLEFIEYAVTRNRVEQAVKELGASLDKHTGDVIRWVFNDIMAEEEDTLKANGLTRKDLGRHLSGAARKHYVDILNELR